ncbi:MAG: hypothetical protein ACTHK7_10465 [Aureliella sp.]
MCTMQQGSASVNSGRHQFFDVIAYDSLGQPQMTVGEGLPLQAAISRSLGFNANPGRFIAAVVPSEATEPAAPAQNIFDRIVEEREAERASNEPVDTSAAVDDSGAIEATEDAADGNLVAGSFVPVNLIRYNCPVTAKRVWWRKPVSKKRARALSAALERRGCSPEVVTVRLTDIGILGLQMAEASEPDEADEDKTYRILCIPNAGGAPYMAEGEYSFEDAQRRLNTWSGDASAWMVEQLPGRTADESLAESIQRAIREGDYPRLPAFGLQLGLVKHLQQVTRAIIDGKVDCVSHIGMVARSLERFACQCIEKQQPEWRFNEWQWVSDDFDAGMNGGFGDPALNEALNCWMDEALERDWPDLFEDAEA